MIPLKQSTGVNKCRQLKAMIKKNLILKIREPWSLVFELCFPFVCGLVLYEISSAFKCNPSEYPNSPDYCT